MIKVSRKDFVREELPDNDPDLSYMGEYVSDPKSDYYIDRETGWYVGPSITEERTYGVNKINGLYYEKTFGVGRNFIIPSQDETWLDSALDNGADVFTDTDYENTHEVTVSWTHPEVLAKGLHTMDRNELRYFVSTNYPNPGSEGSWKGHGQKRFDKKELARFAKQGILPDKKHSNNFWRDVLYTCEDYDRMEDYNRGGWGMIAVRAKIELKIPSHEYVAGDGKKHKSWTTQTITSPGIWGISSDAGESEIESTFQGECEELANMLKEMGMEVTK